MTAIRRVVPAVVLALLILGAWQVAGMTGHLPVTVPSPTAIGAAFAHSQRALAQNIAPTLSVAAAGFAAASLVSLGLAACAVSVPRVEAAIVSFGIIVDSVPLIALTPVLIVLFGIDTSARVVIAALACYLPILIGAIRGFRSPDSADRELFHVLAASPWTRLRLLSFPASLPHLLPAFKIAAPAALLGALVSEWAGAERGLGIQMTYAMFAFDAPQLWMTILTTCALALALYAAFALLERVLVR